MGRDARLVLSGAASSSVRPARGPPWGGRGWDDGVVVGCSGL